MCRRHKTSAMDANCKHASATEHSAAADTLLPCPLTISVDLPAPDGPISAWQQAAAMQAQNIQKQLTMLRKQITNTHISARRC